MTPADDVIARAARAILPTLAARAREATPGADVTPPGEAEVALAIRNMVNRVRPGAVIEEHDLIVQWQPDGHIRVLLGIAAIKPDERT